MWMRAILHVDMDAFYASVEQRDRPELAGCPVIVGGRPDERGVVSAASYEARPFGVRSAMPTAQALRLCPHARLVAPRMEAYAAVSRRLHAIFHRYTPQVQPVSLDEAYLDVTGSQALFGPPPKIGAEIKAAVRREMRLCASVGVAPNRFMAKVASDLEKPDGFTVIPEDQVLRRLDPLPVGRLWGVGPVTEGQLAKLGIRTVAELRVWTKQALTVHFGGYGAELYELARGIDHSPVDPEGMEKSISQELTFPRDVDDPAVLERELLRQAENVAARLRAAGRVARTVQLKLRYDDFSTMTRRRTLPASTSHTDVLHEAACGLLAERTEAGRRRIRLVGLGATNLGPRDEVQGLLFDAAGRDDPVRRDRAEEAVDRIREKLGEDSIRRASLLPEGDPPA